MSAAAPQTHAPPPDAPSPHAPAPHAPESDPAAPIPCDVSLGLIESLRAGRTFVALREDDVQRRSAQLAAILAAVADDGARIVWAGNPLRSPFTIERLLLQVAAPATDPHADYTPAALAELLASADPEAPRRLIVIQQPETIDPATRAALTLAEPHLAAESRPVQCLFCGTTAFVPLETWRPPASLAVLAPTRADGVGRFSVPPRAGLVAIPTLVLLASAGVCLYALGHASVSPRAKPAEAAPAAAASALPHPPPDMATLRQEFDRFLAAQPGRLSQLTPAQRDALFQEYLRHSIPPHAPAKQGEG